MGRRESGHLIYPAFHAVLSPNSSAIGQGRLSIAEISMVPGAAAEPSPSALHPQLSLIRCQKAYLPLGKESPSA